MFYFNFAASDFSWSILNTAIYFIIKTRNVGTFEEARNQHKKTKIKQKTL